MKGGNITIKNTVTHLDGTYISIPVTTSGVKKGGYITVTDSYKKELFNL